MKHYSKILFTLLISTLILLTSCTGYRGLTRNINNHETSVVLSQPNYKIIKYVQGESVAKYFLGIGGYGNKGMIAEARQKMLSHTGMIGKSRAVINETVEVRTKQILLYTEFRYIVSAYVVEFSNDPDFVVPVEEDVLIQSYEEVKEKTVVNTGATLGLGISGNESYYTYPRLGYNLGFSGMYTKPETYKNLFLENQINLTHLSCRTNYENNENTLNSYALDFPLYVGFNVPISDKFSLFLKGGPGLGLLYYHQDYDNTSSNDYSGFFPKLSLGGFTGFNMGNFRTAIGLEWMIADFDEFSSIKLAFTYRLK